MKLPKTLSFDQFMSLAKTMFESNPNIIIITENQLFFGSFCEVKRYVNTFLEYTNHITITSIEVRPIPFSIGDTVMIVDTGEIGYIESIEEDKIYLSSENMIYRGDLMPHSLSMGNVKASQLVKIPTEFISLLQDNENSNR